MSVGAQHRTLREVVADEIAGQILRGDLEPGTRLYEDRLAESLGVSRNPVREAIRALESTGLVTVVPRRGAYVSEIDAADLRNLLELRAVLEGYAAELAAERRDDDVVEQLDRCISAGAAASKAGDVVTAAGHHREFHLAIERASGNSYIAQTVRPLRQQTELVFSVLSDHRSMLSWDEHRRIRDAVAERDSVAARERALEHMSGVIADLAEFEAKDRRSGGTPDGHHT